MSRIGRAPIAVPAGVEVKIDGHTVTIKGPKGTLSRTLNEEMTITMEDNFIHVTRPNDNIKERSLHGLTRTLINNMVVGVTQGFEKRLEIQGVGYNAQMQGTNLKLSLGFKDALDAGDVLQGSLVHLLVVRDDQSEPCGTVSRGDGVFLAADAF